MLSIYKWYKWLIGQSVEKEANQRIISLINTFEQFKNDKLYLNYENYKIIQVIL